VGRALRYVVNVRDRELGVLVTPLSNGRYSVEIEGSSSPPREVTLLEGQELVAVVDRHLLELRGKGGDVAIGADRGPVTVENREQRGRAPAASRAGASGSVRAPMPGRVVKVLVEPGARVKQGDGVVVVEAMKMENELFSPITGSVERVLVAAGDAVERGAPLVEIR
jgi:biotin carboxyl carrier protein